MITKADRQRRDATGWRAEIMSARLLRLKVCRILAQRFKTPVGEINLIAKRASTIAFIEAPLRPSAAAAIESVLARRRRRILRAGRVFMQKRWEFPEYQMRFDLVLVTPGRLPNHIFDAWREY